LYRGPPMLGLVAVGLAVQAPREPSSLHLQADNDFVPFEATYRLPSINFTFSVRGIEPAEGHQFPLYLHVGGNMDRIGPDFPAQRYMEEMARRGYAAALVEVPGQRDTLLGSSESRDQIASDAEVLVHCSGPNGLVAAARKIFTYHGRGDAMSPGPIAMLCRRARVDCSLGIVLHGISLGGLLVGVAPRFATGVTASLTYSSGALVPGGYSCCGLIGGNMSCCDETGQVGGSPLPCEHDETRSPYLERTRRRLILALNDFYYADCEDARSESCHFDSDYSVLYQAKLASGENCGQARDCIMPDGHGYYLPNMAEIKGCEGCRISREQAHIFHRIRDRPGCGPDDHPEPDCGATPDHNPEWVQTDAPWGLTASFDWLAETGRRPL